jgi:hypothetical protein
MPSSQAKTPETPAKTRFLRLPACDANRYLIYINPRAYARARKPQSVQASKACFRLKDFQAVVARR